MTAIDDDRPEEGGNVATEQTPLLQGGLGQVAYGDLAARPESDATLVDSDNVSQKSVAEEEQSVPIYGTLSVLLVGVFVSQTDQSIVLATYAKVASEFDDLNSASWLISSAILASCVAQPLYGKLSQIYGRKACLQAAYILFTIGTAGSGLGRSIGEVIAARAIQGLGGAGMVSMVSIIITDIVPVHEVGTLRSYVNILQTTGRGCGGVIGGLLTEWLGWRWAFLIQVPPAIVAIILVQWRLHLKPHPSFDNKQTAWQKLKRVDFVGATFLCLTIGSFCFVLDRAGQGELSLESPFAIAALIVGGVSLIAFVVSGRYAVEPIFPLGLWIQRAVITNYAIVLLQTAMQVALMSTVPLYIQATQQVNMAQVGAALIPAFAGNLIGGLLAGYWVQRTRTHKPMTIFGASMGLVSMGLCLLLWQGQHFSVLRSLTILPGGFSVGVVSSSAFVALAAGVAADDVAIAGSGMYLSFSVGAIVGVSVGAAVYQSTLVSELNTALTGVHNKHEIIRKALDNVGYVQKADKHIRALLIPCFVAAFHSINYLGLGISSLSVLSAIISPSSKLAPREPSGDEEGSRPPVRHDSI